MENRTCSQCSASFPFTDDDRQYLDRISPRIGAVEFAIPPPRLCPSCRAQRRLQWRNERNFYHRVCGLTGKRLLSIYAEESGFQVYDYDAWWTDAFDALSFGRSYDPSQPFFQQFGALLQAVPQMALIGSNNENCPYCHLLANCKNCYLVIESSNNEDCMYGYWLQKCLGYCEASFSHECSYCHEIDNCYNCYSLAWSKDCTGCSDSFFLDNCIGCRQCFCCANLFEREYCVMNKQLSKPDYQRFLAAQRLGSHLQVMQWLAEAAEFFARFPKKYSHVLRSDNCSGGYIMTSRDCVSCFHAHDAEHCKHGEHVWRNSKHNRDVSTAGRDAEFIYEAINTGISSYNNKFCVQCWTCSDLAYCYGCFNSKNAFGCAGLKHNEYCILNRQYSRSDYADLVAAIVPAMLARNEWGEFFPASISPFCYNETVAGEQFPLTKEQALNAGFRWREKNPREYLPQQAALPDEINEADDSLVKETLACVDCGKNYRIITQELKFCRAHTKPLPRRCPECRHRTRMKRRNPNKLWERRCSSCGHTVLSTYAVERVESILCEECYLREVF